MRFFTKLYSLLPTHPLLLPILIVSCSQEVEDKTPQLRASTFSASRVATYSTQLTKLQRWGDFPRSNRIDLTTCITNKGIRAPIMEEPFAIHFPDGTSVKKTSNEKGCLYWSIDKNFDFLFPQHYTAYPIKIEGIGNYKGSLAITLAIDPWQKDKANVVKDLRFDQLDPRYLHTPSKDSFAPNLHIKSAEISQKKGEFQQLSSSPSYVLSYDVSLWPTYKRVGLNGELIEQPFNEGDFKVVLSLMEKIPSTGQYYNISTTEQETFIKNSFLNTSVTFDVPPQRWPQGASQLEMFIQIVPIEGPDSLGTFHGTVAMKDMTQNSHKAPEQFTPKLDFMTLTSQFRSEPVKDVPPDDFIFEIDSIKAEYGTLSGQSYKQSSEKTLKSKLYLRLASTFHKELIRKTRFLVTVYDQDGNSDGATEERIAPIDSNGILETYALVRYNVYNCAQWRPYTIKIRAIDGQINGLEKERTVLFNPWNKDNFFYDADRQMPPATPDCTPPQVHVNKIEYSNEGLDRDNFHLDTYLNLSIRKIYNIQFSPLLKVTSSHQKETLPTAITYGAFTLRLDLYTPKKAEVNYNNPNLDNFSYITSAEKDVIVEEGVINTDMKMPFDIEETIFLSYKNIVAITLTPKNEPHLRPSTRFFAFDAREAKRNIQTRPLSNYRMKSQDLKILQFIRKSGFKLPRGLLVKNPPPPLQLYQTWLFSQSSQASESFFNFKQLEEKNARLGDPKLILTPLDKERLIFEPSLLAKQTLKKICPLLYHQTTDPDFQDCLNNPEKHIQRRPSNHIIDIITTKPVHLKDGSVLDVPVGIYKEGVNGAMLTGNRISHSQGVRSTDAKGVGDRYSVQKHFSWGIKSPGFIGGEQGVSFANQDESYDRSSQAEMATSFNFNYLEIKQNVLTFNKLALEYTAEVIPCFSVISLRDPDLQFHICDEQSRYSRMTEQWYFVADLNKKGSQFIADPGRLGDLRGPRVIRGRYNFNHFWEQVKKNSRLAIHHTVLYPFKMDYTKQHLLQVQEHQNKLLEKRDPGGYHFFPGLTTPTPESERGTEK